MTVEMSDVKVVGKVGRQKTQGRTESSLNKDILSQLKAEGSGNISMAVCFTDGKWNEEKLNDCPQIPITREPTAEI